MHLSAAILDLNSVPANSKQTTQVLVAKEDESEDPFEDGLLIANLCRQNSQFPLDIGFSAGEHVSFAIKGCSTAIVHLSGYQDENMDDGNLQSVQEPVSTRSKNRNEKKSGYNLIE